MAFLNTPDPVLVLCRQRCLRRRPVLALPMRRRAMSCRRAGKSG